MAKVIYQQFKGKMTKMSEPERPNHFNFLIKWRGMDWSGFRDLRGCVDQFPELENCPAAIEDSFQVVET